MLPYPRIDPDIITIGPISIRWYGAMYVLGFLAAYFLVPRQKRSQEIGLKGPVAQDLIFYAAIGLILGARLGYLLFYQYQNAATYLQHPIEIIATWHGGMSFHGGLVGAVLAGWWFSRRRSLPFLAVADSVLVTVPIGLGLGRLGNFINGELLGRSSSVPWAMVFPDGGALPRHPSQLYEMFFEGILLFCILWIYKDKKKRDGDVFALFLILYGLFRIFCELFREPDSQLGYIFSLLSMGQILSLCMIAIGVVLKYFYLPRTSRQA